MDIYPEDLEPTYRARLRQARGLPDGVLSGGSQYGYLGAMCGMTPGIVLNLWLHIIPNMPFDFFFAGGGGAALGYACGFFVDLNNRSKQRTRKVTAQEIALVSKAETDPLEKEYLSLTSKLISMKPFQETTVDQSIRSTIRDIGCGIARLPGQPAEELLLDAQTFQEEAAQLAAKATRESDPVVAASFQRQSAARSQRAETISRNSALARRNQILRHEMGEHIQALKTMLDTMALGSGGDDHDLAALAENIQQVAIEARSLTEAKQELASALGEGQGGKADVIPEKLHSQGLSGH